MDPNQNSSNNIQNPSNNPFNYPNPNNYLFQNPFPNPNQPQNIPNYGFPPSFFTPSAVPNYHPYYGSPMSYSSQPPTYSSTPTDKEIASNVGATEFPEFSTQMTLGGISGVNEATLGADSSASATRKSVKWTTEQNLVLLSGWIKYGTNSVVGRNQKSESFWGKIAEYCNEHCSFDPPRSGVSCRNHYNYINQKLSKWIGAYDNAKRMQQSGWSEQDVLAKAQEIYSGGGTGNFNLMKEWIAVRDQPRYGSQVGGNSGSKSSGSKRAHDSDASDSNSVGSTARPMGRDAAKKKAKKKGKSVALEVVNEDFNEFKQIKAQEFERLEKLAMLQEEANERRKEAIQRQEEANQRQEEANQLMKEKTRAKKMKMWLKLSEKEHLNDQSNELFQQLSYELFGK
ncbi:glutathione S-transferase T3-like [Brassica napus]|uniref:glutathione S-transferase T3-like n=1 Tax=Brassica napus TaxID=3708 RepID=UPI0020785975|nr:glutathione S-transferase T3-like [Brassica napus]